MTPSRFQGKVVWITGASGGIGEALAQRFALRGARLILSSRRKEELNRVAKLCAGAPSVYVLPIDVSQPQAAADAVREAISHAGFIDVMVHNAGVGQRAYAAETTYEVDDIIMRTNYLGPVALTKALLPSMLAGNRGDFIVVSSVLGKLFLPGRSAYCASKHALHGFFDTLRAEMTGTGIHVTVALPGWVRTQVSINALTGNGGPQRKMDSGTATGFPPEICAERIIAAAEARKAEVNIVKLKENAALYLRRFAPTVLRRIIQARGA